MVKRDVPGFAIGGLSGGEEKSQFWRMVTLSTDVLPKEKPRYLMGVGFALDLVVCVALGCDMFDCVYPTRTAVGAALLCYNIGIDLHAISIIMEAAQSQSRITIFVILNSLLY